MLDFKEVKPVVRELVDGLDEHWIVPGEHPRLQILPRPDGVTEVRYGELFYAAPTDDVIVLPINNTSSENLSAWVGRDLRRRLAQRFDDVDIARLVVSVEETSGQSGVYTYEKDRG